MQNQHGTRNRLRKMHARPQSYFLVGLTLGAAMDLSGCSLVSGISDLPNTPEDGAGEAGDGPTDKSGGSKNGDWESGGSNPGFITGGATTGGHGEGPPVGGRQDFATGGRSSAGGSPSSGGKNGEGAEGGQGGEGAGGGPTLAPTGLSLDEQRTYGLLTMDVPDCVATLIRPDLALAQTSCLDLVDASENRFLAPRTDGWTDVRQGRLTSELSNSGLGLIALGPTPSDSEWPKLVAWSTASREEVDAAAGQSVTCAVWKSDQNKGLVWAFADFFIEQISDGGVLTLESNPDPEILDMTLSGSACWLGPRLLALGVCGGGSDFCELGGDEPPYLQRIDPYEHYISGATTDRELVQFVQPDYYTRPGAQKVQVWLPFGVVDSQPPGIAHLEQRCALRGALANRFLSDERVPFILDEACHPKTGRALFPLRTARPRGELTIFADGVVDVWDGGQYFSQQQSSLDGIVLLTASATTTPLSVPGDWEQAPDGTRQPAFAAVSGNVYFQGAVRGGATPVFTLPPEVRPRRNVRLDIARDSVDRTLVIDPSGVAVITPAPDESEIVSFEGKWFSLTDDDWRNLSLNADWSSVGEPTDQTDRPQVRLHDGLVEFRGHLTASGNTNWPFSLPYDLTPSGYTWLPFTRCSTTSASLRVSITGDAELDAYAVGCTLSLDGVFFGL